MNSATDHQDSYLFINHEVTAAVKRQAGVDSLKNKTYSLVDVNKGGILIDLMKETLKTKNFDLFEKKLREIISPFLYDHGNGKKILISHLVRIRSAEDFYLKERNKKKIFSKSMFKLIEREEKPNNFREVCWKLEKRGYLGETILHVCLLTGTNLHIELAKRIIKIYPKLINDIYISDEFYGESLLHMAVVNEDVSMVKFLLDNGADVNQKCIGNFFCPQDQKMKKINTRLTEEYILPIKTNYVGHVYWGEYPLAFAACLGLKDCYRLLLAKGANPNLVDSNGNMILHMCVISNQFEMLNLAYELGANLNIKNKQGLTPLTLAAKLKRVELFFLILKFKRHLFWQFCGVTHAAYPLDEIDSINNKTGVYDEKSALNLVVFGDKLGHLDMLEGLLMNILQEKWDKFARKKFTQQMITFALYFIVTLFTFVLKPNAVSYRLFLEKRDNVSEIIENNFYLNCSLENTIQYKKPICYNIFDPKTDIELIQMILELVTLFGATIYQVLLIKNAYLLGWSSFFHALFIEPGRVLFYLSCLIIILIVPIRYFCQIEIEDRMITVAMFLTPMHFLYFCRGFKSVGPFVVMIYKMLVSDLLCFVLIYIIFLFGFSQAFFVIHLSHNTTESTNYFSGATESVTSMFLMSLLEFGDIYSEFDNTNHSFLAKTLFVLYTIIVSVLLINMLIAMMGKTYEDIAARPNEWLRQWAKIVLIVEKSISSKQKLAYLAKYTQIKNGSNVFILKWPLSDEELEEAGRIKQCKLAHIKNNYKA